jgi:hypothetical protein
MISLTILFIMNLLALGVMGFYAADIYRRQKGSGTSFAMFVVLAILISLINTGVVNGVIDDMVDNINGSKCKPTTIKKAPYNKKLVV